MCDLSDYVQRLPTHECSPKEFRPIHNITGNHEFDASVEHSKNPDMKAKLADYITTDEAYGPLTAYSGYRNYRGDA